MSPYNFMMDINVMLRKPQPVSMIENFVSVFDKASWILTLAAVLAFSFTFAMIHLVHRRGTVGLIKKQDVPVLDYLIKPLAALVEPNQLMWFMPKTIGNIKVYAKLRVI